MLSKLKDAYNRAISYDVSSLFPIVLIFIITACTALRDDPDCYFIIENGRKILTDGFPHTDWMSMHENLHIVVQQWIPSVINFLVYEHLGGISALFFLYVAIFFVLTMVFFKVVKYVTNNNLIVSYLSSVIVAAGVTSMFGTPRPQPYSLMFALLSIYIMERWRREGNNKFLLLMPVIAIAQANFHSTFFLAVIAVYCAYILFDTIENKKINLKLLISIIVSFAVGLINPYGLEGIFQPLYAIGYEIYEYIGELQKVSGLYTSFFVLPAFAVGFLVSKLGLKKEQRVIAFICLGTGIAAALSSRVILFYFAICALFLSSFFTLPEGELKPLPLSKKDKWFKAATYCTAILFMLIMFLFNFSEFGVGKTQQFKGLTETVNYCIENEDDMKGKTILTPNISEGQYLYHKLGTRAYIDGRLETYIDSLNKKKDISTEYVNAMLGNTDQKEFIESYGFDYLFIYADCGFNTTADKLEKEGSYKCVYSFDEKGCVSYKLYKKVK